MRSRWYSALAMMVIGLAALSVGACGRAGGGDYPSKPIEFVIHTAAGSASDVLGRALIDAVEKEKALSQPITILNKTGGGGAVAFSYVLEKKADPYEILGVPPVFITTPMTEGLSFSYKDFTPIANLIYDKTALVVKPDSPYKTLKDLIEDMKKKPNQLSMGGGSVTAMDNYIRALITKSTGAQWKYVSFDGSDKAITALLGGNVDFASPNPSEVMELIRAGRIRALAVTRKVPQLPDVPTLQESGVEFNIRHFRGIVAPGGIPEQAKKTLEAAVQKATKSEGWRKYLADNGMDEGYLGSDDFGKLLSEMDVILSDLANVLGLKKK